MKRIFIFILVCFLGGVSYLKFINKLESCETVIEIPGMGSSSADKNRNIFSRSYIKPEQGYGFSSDATISRAIQDYKLDKLFKIEAKELKTQISNRIETSLDGDTDLIKIKTYALTKDQAQKINYAIVQSYMKRKAEKHVKRRLESVRAFKDKLRIQEDKVEDHKTRLYALSKKFGITYTSSTDLIRNREESLKKSAERGDLILLAEEKPRMIKVAEDYERELAILKAIHAAMRGEMFTEKSSKNNSVKTHEKGWTLEIEAMMETRRIWK